MWIIEHSTTPPDVVNSLSHSGPTLGRNPQKIRCVSQPSALPACHNRSPHPALLPYATLEPGRKTSSNRMSPTPRARFSWALNFFFRRSAEGSVHKELPSRLQNTEPVVCRNCELVIRCGQHPGFYCLFTNSLKTNCLSGLVHLHSRTSIAKIIITSPLTCFRNLVITNGVLPDEFGGVPLLAEVRLRAVSSARYNRKILLRRSSATPFT